MSQNIKNKYIFAAISNRRHREPVLRVTMPPLCDISKGKGVLYCFGTDAAMMTALPVSVMAREEAATSAVRPRERLHAAS